MLALTVVISKVPSAAITVSSASRTSSLVMTTSVWSAPIAAAAVLAYLRSIASISIPIAYVLIFFGAMRRAAIAHTSEESSPPERRKPTGESESRRLSTAFTRSSLILALAVPTSSWQTAEGSSGMNAGISPGLSDVAAVLSFAYSVYSPTDPGSANLVKTPSSK